MISTCAKVAGIRKRLYPHLFRHSFATWALSRGMNPVQLKDILGHSSLAMITNVYSHLAPEDAHAALMAAIGAEVVGTGQDVGLGSSLPGCWLHDGQFFATAWRPSTGGNENAISIRDSCSVLP